MPVPIIVWGPFEQTIGCAVILVALVSWPFVARAIRKHHERDRQELERKHREYAAHADLWYRAYFAHKRAGMTDSEARDAATLEVGEPPLGAR